MIPVNVTYGVMVTLAPARLGVRDVPMRSRSLRLGKLVANVTEAGAASAGSGGRGGSAPNVLVRAATAES